MYIVKGNIGNVYVECIYKGIGKFCPVVPIKLLSPVYQLITSGQNDWDKKWGEFWSIIKVKITTMERDIAHKLVQNLKIIWSEFRVKY